MDQKSLQIAIVLGGAETLWRDFDDARNLFDCYAPLDAPEPIIIATNRAGVDFPVAFDHWATYHQELMPHWISCRLEKDFPFRDDLKYWTVRRQLRSPVNNIDWNLVEPIGGSSGMIGTQVGLEVADRVIICGVPLDPLKHYHSFNKNEPWTECDAHRHAWKRRVDEYKPRVRSMSGWTQEMLGGPDREFFNAYT